jgi:signal-transduction protein with cAMP-binding, CBS, and nucleotidyltransferase domain
MLESKPSNANILDSKEFLSSVSILDLPDAKFVSAETTVEEVKELLKNGGFGSLLLGSQENLRGIVTERDFLFKIALDYDALKGEPIESFMTVDPMTQSSEDTLGSVVSLMCNKEFRHLPIKFENGYKMLSVNDLIKYFLGHFAKDLQKHGTKVQWSKDGVYLQEYVHYDETAKDQEEISSRIFETPLRKIMFREALHTDSNSTLAQVIESLRDSKKGSALIMDFETELKGIISERDFLRKIYGEVDIHTALVKDYMTADPHKLLEQDLIAVALNNMSKFKYRSVIVANQGGYPISIVSILDILKYMASKFETE